MEENVVTFEITVDDIFRMQIAENSGFLNNDYTALKKKTHSMPSDVCRAISIILSSSNLDSST